MSDAIKHECGIAVIRLRKPLQYYIDKYGTPLWGVNKLYLLMEKQHNRGQDGAGVANIRLNMEPGNQFISRLRSIDPQPLQDIFKKVNKHFRKAQEANAGNYYFEPWLKENVDFSGELWLGHLRYGTHGGNSIEQCHPMMRINNWRSRNLIMAGNFNMTNVDELFDRLVEIGQHPKDKVDTVTVMEKIGHFLDEEIQRHFDHYKTHTEDNREISRLIEGSIDLQRVLRRSCRDFDGGYAMAGLTGYGAAFVARDPNGIRPAYWFANDEVVVVASEKPAIKTAFGINYNQIEEVKPGHALIIDQQAQIQHVQFIEQQPPISCSFERIYFSRGTDPEIYRERKALGELLTNQVLEAVDFNIKNSVFSYIPNTAETAFLGLMSGVEKHLFRLNAEKIKEASNTDDLEHLFHQLKPRIEKLVIKDVKMRTFITNEAHRDEMVAHVYDTTYEVINKNEDTLVVLDDSIVRGTTLEKSILTMLDKLSPKKIVVVSSAPQIRYPDCYGIDMSRIKDFVAFRALLKLIEFNGLEYLLDEVYERCKAAIDNGTAEQTNFVKMLYDRFTDDQISDMIAKIVTPKGCQAEIKVVYQTVENLHKACPKHKGDWYFTGNYPTPGGNRVVNKAFVNFMQGKEVRAY